MNRKKSGEASSRRDKNKKYLGVWMDKGIVAKVKKLAKDRGHSNASIIVVEALTDYLRRNPPSKKKDT